MIKVVDEGDLKEEIRVLKFVLGVPGNIWSSAKDKILMGVLVEMKSDARGNRKVSVEQRDPIVLRVSYEWGQQVRENW